MPSLAPPSPLFGDDQWTDALPLCTSSGVGYSTNITYRHNGQPTHEHPCEDVAFTFCQSENLQLYGLLDGYYGAQVANYAAQKMPAEILLDPLDANATDEQVQNVLKQAFYAVERGYMDSISELLAHRANLIEELKGNTTYEASQKYPEKVESLNAISHKVSCGSSSTLALICNGKIYIANLGHSRALLCRGNASEMRVMQVGACHDISNEDEVGRMAELEMDESALTHFINNRLPTRCLGDFARKGGYKECFDLFKNATGEPVIAEPELSDPIVIDDQCLFLVLLSAGAYYAMFDSTQNQEEVNPSIAGMVATEFFQQSTLNAVAQAVVDRIGRLHHDSFLAKGPYTPCAPSEAYRHCQTRGDITLVLRNFHFPFLESKIKTQLFLSPTSAMEKPAMQAESSIDMTSTSCTDEFGNGTISDTISSTLSDVVSTPRYVLPLDKDGRIAPYVDFTDFYKKCDIARQEATQRAGKSS